MLATVKKRVLVAQSLGGGHNGVPYLLAIAIMVDQHSQLVRNWPQRGKWRAHRKK